MFSNGLSISMNNTSAEEEKVNTKHMIAGDD